MTLKPIHVAVGVVFDAQHRVLIARRAECRHQGGLWEFPGGKVEPGEASVDALARELGEELGIHPRDATPLLRVPFSYPERRVLLDCWRVTAFSGQPAGREGQSWRWVAAHELPDYTFPPANAPIVRAASLPACLVITPPWLETSHALLGGLDAVLAKGHRLILWRVPGLAPSAVAASARAALARCRGAGARLIVHDDPPLAKAIGADGVHLTAASLAAGNTLSAENALVSASCHGEVELAAALAQDVDFVTVSPVMATASHPEAQPLGWERFAALIAGFPRPVYALGGVGPDSMAQARCQRAQGVAGIRGFWPVS